MINVAVGDKVTRILAGVAPMVLKVTEVTATTIVCGWWTFDRETGHEIDEDLGWGPGRTGSWLVDPNEVKH